MKMKIYNTLTGDKEEIKPVNKEEISIYVCGPTVYGPDHLGHARTWIFFDWLRRYFEAEGEKVKFIQNITDVGSLVGDEEEGPDKIEKEAKAEGKTPEEIARFFEAEHIKDLAALNIEKPDYLPRATDNIQEIIAFIKVLIDKGFAYEKSGNVYFEVEKLPTYGELSGRKLDEMLEGTRITNDPEKKNAYDFALWKKADGHIQKWPSPWGEGYPGWHIECSVMSSQLLGQPFDIHGSAVEHVFPHHENEMAQSRAYAGKPLANYWIHSGMLNIDGVKMSKSKGNYITVKDVLKEYSPDIVKLAFMQSLWSKPADWGKSAIFEATKLDEKLLRAKSDPSVGASDFQAKLKEILDDNFNTPKALVLINEKIGQMTAGDYEYLEKIFGLELKPNEVKLTPEQDKMVFNREEARKDGDFELADKLRQELAKDGIMIEDTEEGTIVRSRG